MSLPDSNYDEGSNTSQVKVPSGTRKKWSSLDPPLMAMVYHSRINNNYYAPLSNQLRINMTQQRTQSIHGGCWSAKMSERHRSNRSLTTSLMGSHSKSQVWKPPHPLTLPRLPCLLPHRQGQQAKGRKRQKKLLGCLA